MPEYERDTRLCRMFPGKYQPGPAYQIRLKDDDFTTQLIDNLKTLISRYEAGETLELVAWANPDESISINFRGRPAPEQALERPQQPRERQNGYAAGRGQAEPRRRQRPPQPVFDEMDADPYDDWGGS